MRKRTFTILWITAASIAMAACRTTSPSSTLQAYISAVKNRDLEAYKRTLSTRMLIETEKALKSQNMSFDDEIKTQLFRPGYSVTWPDPVQTRGETIDDNMAHVYVNSGQGWRRVKLVKEDGEWKIDRLFDDSP